MKKRGSGILLHITSLPSPFGIGDLGPAAYRFADFLQKTHQTFWQILPLSPTEIAHGCSPYYSISAFAGNPLLISPELLMMDGLLSKAALDSLPAASSEKVDFSTMAECKEPLFDLAFERFQAQKEKEGYRRFCAQHADWLEDYVLFKTFMAFFEERPWNRWPPEIKNRNPDALQDARFQFSPHIEKEKFLQYVFFKQWDKLKSYCNHRGIQIIGDIPIYLPFGSVDVWCNPQMFKLNDEKEPVALSGVPPDYFSASGQLWGHPVYKWDFLKSQGYEWWIKRIQHNFHLHDVVRIDHFRGLVAYWEVPTGEETAVNGQWVDVPVMDFFNQLFRRCPMLPLIAEDLGTITPDVREVIHRLELPGMKVLLFAFGDDFPSGAFLPHNMIRNCVAYTGTHDNNTVRGWYEKEAGKAEKTRLFRYLGREVPADSLHWEMIRLVSGSVADMVIFPMQDILGLDESARMNHPASGSDNWRWRMTAKQFAFLPGEKLAAITETYERI